MRPPARSDTRVAHSTRFQTASAGRVIAFDLRAQRLQAQGRARVHAGAIMASGASHQCFGGRLWAKQSSAHDLRS